MSILDKAAGHECFVLGEGQNSKKLRKRVQIHLFEYVSVILACQSIKPRSSKLKSKSSDCNVTGRVCVGY